MTAQKWRALSLKRLAYLTELRRSGRWQRHFTTGSAFDDALQAANADAERWKGLAYVDAPPLQAAE